MDREKQSRIDFSVLPVLNLEQEHVVMDGQHLKEPGETYVIFRPQSVIGAGSRDLGHSEHSLEFS